MMEYKYNDKAWIGRKVGEILADRMAKEAYHPDLVVPVPIHKAREAKRGYNQVAIMAKVFSAKSGLLFDDQLLLRIKDTLPMRNLGVSERVANVADAFVIRTHGGEASIQDKNVLLIDDIYTTGSTADSCTQTLLLGGAKEVRLLTFAAGANVIPAISLQHNTDSI